MTIIIEFVNIIIDKHIEYSKEYQENRKISFNQKNITVAKLKENGSYYKDIMEYHAFLNTKNLSLYKELEKFLKKGISVSSRVKNHNSILSKIERYGQQFGESSVPLNKCLNDLYGARIIVPDELYDTIVETLQQMAEDNSNMLKSRNADKDDYKAHHLNIKYNNTSYPWEVQVWKKYDEENNYISHSKYKQEYTKWESEE